MLALLFIPVLSLATTYQAETGTLSGGAIIASCSTASGGQLVNNLGKNGANSGVLTFDVNVATAATYKVHIEYLAKESKNMDITINNDVSATQSYTFSSSGDWCYQGGRTATKYIDMYLNSGDNTIKFHNDVSSAPLIDYIDIYNPQYVTTKYEAEHGTLGGLASIATCSRASNGQMVTNIKFGAANYLEFAVTANKAGIHHMVISYYSIHVRNLVLSVNGGSSEIIKVPASGNSWCYQNGDPNEYSINVNLNLGSNTIRMTAESAEEVPIIDCITLSVQHPKKGLIVGSAVNAADVTHFEDYISWYYRYNPIENSAFTSWASDHNVEYVPIIGYGTILTNTGVQCALVEKGINPPNVALMCTYQQVEDTINSNDMRRVKYVMGTNEPWNEHDADITPTEGVSIWKTYIQPLRENLGIKLVSPNVNQATAGLDWLEEFLKGCFDDAVCDEDLIDIWAVHEYECKESYFDTHYGPTGSFFSNMKTRMGSYGSKDWNAFIDNMKLWVTETNCFWETWTDPHPTNIAQCQSITYQKEGSHGIGSIQWLDRNDRIERYAWWTTTNNNPAKTQLLIDYTTRNVNPCGRGYKDPVSTTTC